MSDFLYVLCGIPASGKSTWAKDFAKDGHTEIISTDEIRKELFGNEESQQDNNKVFQEAFKRIKTSSKDDVVFDATNISAKRRRALVREMRPWFYVITAVPFVEPLEVCLKRNGERERKVPEDVIRRMFCNYAIPTKDEGFDHVASVIDPRRDTILDKPFWDLYEEIKDKYFTDMEHDSPHHLESVAEHIQHGIKLGLELKGAWSRQILFALLFHDLGKFFTKIYREDKGYYGFFGHENVSSQIAKLYTNDDFTLRLVKYHMLLHQNMDKAKEYFHKEEHCAIELFAEIDRARP